MVDDVGVLVTFCKGHGTENDFVVVPDLDACLDLSPPQVRLLADRRAGIGGDGVIRVVRTRDVPEVADQAAVAEWFMDYRNADGSTAQMCGNGARVFVAYLLREGLVRPGTFDIATRGGPRSVRVDVHDDEPQVRVDLGPWRLVRGAAALAEGGDTMVRVAGLAGPVPGLSIDLGNPHVVVMLPGDPTGPDLLTGLDLRRAPVLAPDPPQGSNVEFVVLDAPGRLRMRVYERGVGETRSCGTGAAAAALAARAWTQAAGGPQQDDWPVDVPGGALTVTVTPQGVELGGPAELVADGQVRLSAAVPPGTTTGSPV
jgi:diaminopimelate epimerase